jgi:hypothetical protein
MLRLRIIHGPSNKLISTIIRRAVITQDIKEDMEDRVFGAVCMLQAPFPDMYYLFDVAEKASDVIAMEVLGNCPHQFGCIALFGDSSSVKIAASAIGEAFKQLDQKGFSC